MTFREINKILNSAGFVLIRTAGSHCQYRKVGCPFSIVVPNHSGKDISIGVLKDLEKKTGLSLRRQSCFLMCARRRTFLTDVSLKFVRQWERYSQKQGENLKRSQKNKPMLDLLCPLSHWDSFTAHHNRLIMSHYMIRNLFLFFIFYCKVPSHINRILCFWFYYK